MLAQALDTTGAVLAAVTPADLDAPTPCTTMNVRELVDHLLMAGSRIASAARGDELSAWAITGPDLPFEAWGDAWQTVADAARAEWAADDERLDRPTQLPWATVAGRQAAAVYANELLVHAWDLAAAIDARPEWDDDAIEVASASIRRGFRGRTRSRTRSRSPTRRRPSNALSPGTDAIPTGLVPDRPVRTGSIPDVSDGANRGPLRPTRATRKRSSSSM